MDLQGSGFSVAFDPLDGSSIVDTNFTVGTIFGVWPGDKLTGITGRDQVRSSGRVKGLKICQISGSFRPSCIHVQLHCGNHLVSGVAKNSLAVIGCSSLTNLRPAAVFLAALPASRPCL